MTDNKYKSSFSTHHRFAVAPMMDWTTRYCRYFHRTMTRHSVLYTEMVTADAVIHGNRQHILGFDNAEHPISVQLGGSEPHKLAEAAKICEAEGYDEINLNVGCPSDRVQSGAFGACLMAEPQTVAKCVAAMKQVVRLPITVKCRIGIDDQDSEEALDTFADAVVAAGVDALTVHARKAWLKGLSPKDNRTIPPLDYERVYRLKKRFPALHISINGGITSLAEAQVHLAQVDGVMLGRAAYQDPALLLDVDAMIYGDARKITAVEAVEHMLGYAEQHIGQGGKLSNITRHMLGLFNGQKGARAYRRYLSENAVKPDASAHILHEALALIQYDAEAV